MNEAESYEGINESSPEKFKNKKKEKLYAFDKNGYLVQIDLEKHKTKL